MSWKLFIQIILLIIIASVIFSAVKCIKKSYCPVYKSKTQACDTVSK